MTLKESVEKILEEQKRTLTWLAGEMDRTYSGFKLSLENETIKYSDIKKMQELLNVPMTVLFDTSTTIYQKNKGGYNAVTNNSQVNEDAGIYKNENQILRDKIVILENTIKDKQHIIDLLSKKE